MIDLATNYPDAVAFDATLVCQAAQELRAFGWYRKRDCDHSFILMRHCFCESKPKAADHCRTPKTWP
jgi:hypothetical protein